MKRSDLGVRIPLAQTSVHSPQPPSHVIIIGGGISGLSTAYALQEQARLAGMPFACTLIEARERLGGVILTERVGDFVIEAGPDSLLTQKPWGLDLCHSLGISDRLIGTNDRQRRIYILWGGRLHALPQGLMLIVPTRVGPLLRSQLLSWPGKLRMGLEYFLPPRPPAGDESLAGFVRRRLGREALEKIADPLLAGIYAGSSDDMSVLATFPRLRELERTTWGVDSWGSGAASCSCVRLRPRATLPPQPCSWRRAEAWQRSSTSSAVV